MPMTLEEELLLAFDESKINRVPKGKAGGGRFTSKSGGGGSSGTSKSSKSTGKSNKSVGKSSGGKKPSSSTPVKSVGSEKTVDKKLKEVKKLHKEVKERTNTEAIVKHTAAGLAIEALYHKVKPNAKKAAIKAAELMKSKFGQTAKTAVKDELVKKPITKAIGTGAKKAINNRPGWKVIAERSKKLASHPAVKKAAQLLAKTGKFAGSVVIGAAPYLARAAQGLGIFLSTATVPQLVLAGTIAAATAYGIYKIRQKLKERRKRKDMEELFRRFHEYRTQNKLKMA